MKRKTAEQAKFKKYDSIVKSGQDTKIRIPQRYFKKHKHRRD